MNVLKNTRKWVFGMDRIGYVILIICCLVISCNQKETSNIEKIIVDEKFIKAKVDGYDSLSVDSLESKTTITTYFLKDDFKIVVSRDSLKRIQAWWLRDNEDKTIEGAEVSIITGQILGKMPFVNGKIDGDVKYYYDDGRIRSIGKFKNGLWWGIWKNYDKKGNLILIEDYKDGNINGDTISVEDYNE